ncbi:MAG: immunoglobulin domain-containing protein [Opitutaceae bacterium]
MRKITPTGTVTTLAGISNGITGSTDGTGSAARFNTLYGVAVDGSGNVYVADTSNKTIRKITPAGVVTTLAGLTGSTGSTDGTGIAVRFSDPQGIAVDARGNLYVADTNNHSIRMSVFPPDFTTHPASQVVSPGANATFTATATSNVPITYQWQKDGTAIAGATTTTLIVSNVQTANLGNYTLVATNMAGATTSNPGALSFFPPPSFATHPASHIVSPGGTAAFTATATSSVPFTYQWQKDGVAIAGATTSTLSVPNVQTANLGSYVLVATNPAGSTPSNPAVLSFTPPPSFATHPASQSVAEGATATFTATATSNLPITYQWRRDGVAIPGATTTTLNVSNVQAGNLGNYTLVATNSVGSTTSNVAELSFAFSNPGRLINLSIRTSLAAGGDSFTMGYVVGGSGTSGAKPLVIRVAGPSLTQLGVPGALDDPQMELFAGPTKTGENDNWGGTPALANAMAGVGAFPFTGTLSRDAAAAVNINSSDNSVRVSAVGTGSGEVIAELYDATPTTSFSASTPRLVNVSVLKHLGTGVTAGFVIGGATAKTVLIRAVGPTIGAAPFNVSGVVLDPQLTLFSGQTSIGTNNNWGGTGPLTAAFAQVGAFPLPATSLDAAVLATLLPGNYTVQVSGVGNTTGVAIVEVYEVP